MARRPPSLATRPRRAAVLQRQRVGRLSPPARGKARLRRRSDPDPARRREARTRRHDQGQPRNSCLGPPPGRLPHQAERRRPAAERRSPRVPDRSHPAAGPSAQERRHHGDAQRAIVDDRARTRTRMHEAARIESPRSMHATFPAACGRLLGRDLRGDVGTSEVMWGRGSSDAGRSGRRFARV